MCKSDINSDIKDRSNFAVFRFSNEYHFILYATIAQDVEHLVNTIGYVLVE